MSDQFPFPPREIVNALVNVASATTTTVVSAKSGKRIKVYGMLIQAAGTNNLTFQDNSGTPVKLLPLVDFTARERLLWQPNEAMIPMMTLVSGKQLDLVTTTASQVSGIVYYAYED